MNHGVNRDLIDFISSELRIAPDRLLPTTRLVQDLGVDGADGSELIESFGRRFRVDLSTFESKRYFGPEAGFSPFLWLSSIFSGRRANLTPITLADLQASIELSRWAEPNHAAV